MQNDPREMFEEVNALLTSVAKALEMEPEEAVRAIEAGEIAMSMDVDEEGRHFVGVTHGGRQSRIYPGAIRHAPEAAAEDDGCGHGGCGCGH